MFGFIEGWRLIAGIFGLAAVAVGALAAHALHDQQAIVSVERAATYQLIHAVMLFVTLGLSGRSAAVAKWCFLFGILLFCGSIYLKYFFGFAAATKLAPEGGLFFMLGWFFLALGQTVKR